MNTLRCKKRINDKITLAGIVTIIEDLFIVKRPVFPAKFVKYKIF
ncbi:hypothetical protein TREVI0001_1116 [Treponema vincentii ATCC 35580]|uniref:Uncharacterized protein n=1 Tax=Treponema vincentii ATCC 35580 TaxID=596324 RepID=C8PP53_9SPIR|nr:hypothetical protein TREVI0001_1116 [Treponema vincentii ATCC 35580]